MDPQLLRGDEFNSCTFILHSFDLYLILNLRRISRRGINSYVCWHTSRNTISMDATFYSILPSEEYFHGMDCQLVADQAGLSLTWSQPPKTGFLVTRHILLFTFLFFLFFFFFLFFSLGAGGGLSFL